MSITSALLGLGIVLASVGGLGSIFAFVNLLVEMDEGDAQERKRARDLMVIVTAVLAIGGFLLGLTIPAVQQ
jgi:hypothetical protein